MSLCIIVTRFACIAHKFLILSTLNLESTCLQINELGTLQLPPGSLVVPVTATVTPLAVQQIHVQSPAKSHEPTITSQPQHPEIPILKRVTC